LPIARIDAQTNDIGAAFSVGGPSLGFNSGTAGGLRGPSGIALGGGAVWVASETGVVRVSARTHSVTATVELGVAIPAAIAIGARSVWVASRPGFRCCPAKTVGKGTLTRIDPATNSVEATLPIGGQPAGVAFGDGSVWVADAGTRSVLRVDPAANRIVERIEVGAAPRGIAVGRGFVWIAVG
jgi:YVTN family beta-propeller protein